MEFTAVVENYLNAKISGRKPIRPNTLEGYMSAIRCHLLPKWTGREMESITSDEMQAWVDSFELPGAAKKAFFTLRQIMRWYLRTYHVRIYDETQSVELPSKPRRKPRALTAKQAASSLRDMRGEEWEASALVQLSCGLRPCEAIALTWADLNLKSGEVDVHSGLHEAFGNVYSSPTKTEKSTRTVVLPRYAVERLRQLRRELNPKRTDRLCTLRPSAYRRKVRAWFAKRGIRMCAQWLRHSWGSLAVQAGVKIETVALMLGHESLDTAYYVAMAIHSTSIDVAADDDELLTTRISKPLFVIPETYISHAAKMAAAPALSPGDPLKHATTCGTDANSLGNVTDVVVVPLGFVWHT